MIADEVAQLHNDIIVIMEGCNVLSTEMNIRFCKVAEQSAPLKQNSSNSLTITPVREEDFKRAKKSSDPPNPY